MGTRWHPGRYRFGNWRKVVGSPGPDWGSKFRSGNCPYWFRLGCLCPASNNRQPGREWVWKVGRFVSRLRWWGGGGCKFGSCIICVYSIIINKRILTLRINCIIGPLQFPTLASHLTAQLIIIRMHPSFSSNTGFLSVSDFLTLLPVQQPRLKFNSEIFSSWAADRFLSAPLKRSGLYFIMNIDNKRWGEGGSGK